MKEIFIVSKTDVGGTTYFKKDKDTKAPEFVDKPFEAYRHHSYNDALYTINLLADDTKEELFQIDKYFVKA